MAEEFISFGASDLDHATLQEVLASQLAYEQARIIRSLAMRRLAAVAAIVAALLHVVHALSWADALLLIAIVSIAFGYVAWLEHRAHSRFVRALTNVPHRRVTAEPDESVSR